jgi:hypothetical protein
MTQAFNKWMQSMAEATSASPIDSAIATFKDIGMFIKNIREDSSVPSLSKFLSLSQEERDRKLLAISLAGTGGTIRLRGGGVASREATKKAIRETIQQEMKARGPAPTFEPKFRTSSLGDEHSQILADNRALAEAKGEEATSRILRGTFFHGGDPAFFPPQGTAFPAEAVKRTGNLGEPLGISLSADPQVSSRLFGKTSQKQMQAKSQFRTHKAKLADRAQAAYNEIEALYKPLLSRRLDYHDKLNKIYRTKGIDAHTALREDPALAAEWQDLAKDLNEQLGTLKPSLSNISLKNIPAELAAPITHRRNYAARNIRQKLEEPFIGRILPRYGAPPEEVMLQTTRSGKDAEMIADAYSKAYMKHVMPTTVHADPEKLPKELNQLLKLTETKKLEDKKLYQQFLTPELNKLAEKLPDMKRVLERALSGELTAKQLRVDLLLPYTAFREGSEAQFLSHLYGEAFRKAWGKLTYPRTLKELETALPAGAPERRAFNETMRQELLSRGKKGILYSPQRYDEYEILMFNPEDATLLDWRQVETQPEMSRFQKRKTPLLADFYRERRSDMAESLGKIYESLVDLPALASRKEALSR